MKNVLSLNPMHPDEIIRTEESFKENQIEIIIENEDLNFVDEIQHTDVPLNVLEPITKQYLREVKQMISKGNRFYFSDGVSEVEVKVVSDEIIRVRVAPLSQFLDEFSYALADKPMHVTRIDATTAEEYYSVSTNTVSCRIYKSDFRIAFVDLDENVINEDHAPMHWEEHSEFGGYYVYATKKYQPGEHFFGLGDKPMDLDLLGKRVQTWGTDAYNFHRETDPLYKNIPFYIGIHSNKSYGIFFDNTFKTFFDFGKESNHQISFWADGGEMQYYYIHGPHMMDVVKRYCELTGSHPMPPKWALGFQMSRWGYFPEKKVKELTKTFRDKKVPCDVIHFDIDYMDGYRCFTWNKKYFPNPKKLIDDLMQTGFKVVAIIDPGIKMDDNYWVFKEGKEQKYFCRRSDDYFMEGNVWPGRCQFPDFTNPKVREWWGTLFKELVAQGVAGIWTDMNEPAVFGLGTFPLDVRHNYDGYRGSHRKAHNVYGMQMVRATYDGLKKLMKNKRPFTITRSGYAGMQRYSSTWTGDNHATWDHLKLAVQMMQRLSMSGVSFAGSDIGGFTGEPDGELYTRWIQFGVFSPFMRVHSAGDTREREPWTFGKKYEEIVKIFIELRYKLIPYIYSVFWENSRYNFPMLRSIAMMEQEVTENFSRDDQFVFGDKLLVAPILEYGATSREVYLPKGLWYNFWNFQVYQGNQTHYIDSPLESMPIFVKAGAVIPEAPVMQYVDEHEIDVMLLNVYFAPYHVNSFLFEDNGDTFGYEQEIYSEKKFETLGTEKSLLILQSIEGMFTPRYQNYRIKIYGLPFSVAKVFVDGKEIKAVKKVKHNKIVVFDV
ncbi:MAG: glycoside hydrolase family 31 protein, partial [Chitinophagales bacterium]|nr:glycoside hydrolase family 31 protein [Chitinophagales bacterium]